MQDDELTLLTRLAPDLMDEIGRRAMVLERIDALQPVGRRALASRLNLPEREVRAVASALKDQGFITLDAAGMTMTSKAFEVIEGARALSRAMYGLTTLEKLLRQRLQVKRVLVVAGDADREEHVLRDVGRASAHCVRQMLRSGMTLAVTGGRTMTETARGMTCASPLNIMVVPARGGVGAEVETQASAVAAEIAQRLGGHYRVLHLPDNLDKEALSELCRLPEVREAVELLQRADLVVHGAGRADVMAQNRALPKDVTQKLLKDGAVGETFGDFFDLQGRTVYRMSTLSVGLGRLQPACRYVLVAAGAQKGEAIVAALRHEKHDTLITDEGAAREILRLSQ